MEEYVLELEKVLKMYLNAGNKEARKEASIKAKKVLKIKNK